MTVDAALVAAFSDALDDRIRLTEPVRFEQSDPSWSNEAGTGVTVVAVPCPRLSWRIASAPAKWRQAGAELALRRPDGLEEVVTLAGDDQILVDWPFLPLASRDRVQVRVRVCGDAGWSAWGPWSGAEATLLLASDWVASWIAPAGGGALSEPAPMIGTTFEVGQGLRSARLHITALGLVDPVLNGSRVSADRFVPGWTTYDKLVRFRTYDVTAALRAGDNRFETALGNGWYRGRIASLPIHRGAVYGERLGLLAQFDFEYDDGRRMTVASGEDWRWAPTGILENDFYDGQHTDLRVSQHPALDRRVEALQPSVGRIEAAVAPPVRELRIVKPVQSTVADGRQLVDFGTNLVGWVRLHVDGLPAGAVVTVRHAEVLEQGQLATRPLRSALATDSYIVSGVPKERLEPAFTYHGFRFAEVSGIPAGAKLSIEAVVLGSALTRTGWFSSSSEDLNKLHRNVVNSMAGNFLDIPTDCPQRDERLGWTGDIQVFAPTASTLFDVSSFLDGWLESLAIDQLADGTVPAVVPRVFREETALAGWGDAAVIVPWVLFERYGDEEVLRRQYPSMSAWVHRVMSLAGRQLIWSGEGQLGDWLDPIAPPDDPGAAQADPAVVATACFFHSVDLLARTADALGLSDDARRYGRLAAQIRLAFCAEFVGSNGRVRSDCQTVYALAITWGLILDPDVRAGAAARLVELVEAQGHTVATGFIGTPLVLHALTLAGRTDVAYEMLTAHERPSWLYAVDHGATTIWERWDSLLPDGSVNSGTMTSFNHYAFGAVANWMHRTIGGITSLAPGSRIVRVAPIPGAGLKEASLRHDSPYGPIQVRWTLRLERFRMTVEIPVGVTAEVSLPDGTDAGTVGHGRHEFTTA